MDEGLGMSIIPVHVIYNRHTIISSNRVYNKIGMLGSGSFVRGRKRKKVDSRPFLYHRGVRSIREKPVETSHYISINDPVSQSYICQTPLVHDSIENRQTAPLLGTRYYLRNSS